METIIKTARRVNAGRWLFAGWSILSEAAPARVQGVSADNKLARKVMFQDVVFNDNSYSCIAWSLENGTWS